MPVSDFDVPYSNFFKRVATLWRPRSRRSVFQKRHRLNPVLEFLRSGKPVIDHIGTSQMEQTLTARFVH